MCRLRPEIAHLKLGKLLAEDGPGPADVRPVSLADIIANVDPKYLFKHLWLFMHKDGFAMLSALLTHSEYKIWYTGHRLLSNIAF